MKLFFKILAVILLLASVSITGFILWGGRFEQLLNGTECAMWFAQTKPYAWAAGIGLLISDLVLPIPATGVISALGSVYGIFAGTLIGVAGSAGAGISGYALARVIGKKGTRFIASDKEIDTFKSFFDKWGGTAIIISRIMPVLPEVMTILAGLAGMNHVKFVTALFLGTIPTCFLFAYIGYSSRVEPVFGIALAVIIPLCIWPFFIKFAINIKVR